MTSWGKRQKINEGEEEKVNKGKGGKAGDKGWYDEEAMQVDENQNYTPPSSSCLHSQSNTASM